jgi:hypothetical protein
MAKDHGSSVKNDKQYEGLRKKGMSKQRAASIANSPGSSSRGGKKSGKGSGAASHRSVPPAAREDGSRANAIELTRGRAHPLCVVRQGPGGEPRPVRRRICGRPARFRARARQLHVEFWAARWPARSARVAPNT